MGAYGTIGKELCELFEKGRHRVIRVSRTSCEYQANISDKRSLENLFATVGEFDAVANAAGDVAAAPLEKITVEQFMFSIHNKMMGQINLVRTALPYIADNGSFTLVSDILSGEPILGVLFETTINGPLKLL